MKKETLENHGMLVKGRNKQRAEHSTVKTSENVQTIDLTSWRLYLGPVPTEVRDCLPEKCVLNLKRLNFLLRPLLNVLNEEPGIFYFSFLLLKMNFKMKAKHLAQF